MRHFDENLDLDERGVLIASGVPGEVAFIEFLNNRRGEGRLIYFVNDDQGWAAHPASYGFQGSYEDCAARWEAFRLSVLRPAIPS